MIRTLALALYLIPNPAALAEFRGGTDFHPWMLMASQALSPRSALPSVMLSGPKEPIRQAGLLAGRYNLFDIAVVRPDGEWSRAQDIEALPYPSADSKRFFKAFLGQLNGAISQLLEYDFIYNDIRVRIPAYFQDVGQSYMRILSNGFSPTLRRISVNFHTFNEHFLNVGVQFSTTDTTDEIWRMLYLGVAFAVHDYGHVVDENEGIVWISREHQAAIEARGDRLRATLNTAENKLLKAVLTDLRAEVYRFHFFPQEHSDPYADHFSRLAREKWNAPPTATLMIQMANYMAAWEHDKDLERCADVMRYLVAPLESWDVALYHQAIEIITYVRDYRNAHRYNPAWVDRAA